MSILVSGDDQGMLCIWDLSIVSGLKYNPNFHPISSDPPNNVISMNLRLNSHPQLKYSY